MAVIVGFNMKGGSGKSTLIGNLAGEFHQQGLTVATIDLDPQGSLTQWATAGEGLLSQVTLEIPGLHSMTDAAKTKAVLSALEDARSLADIILVDTPPLLAGVSVATLEKADLALIPVQPTAKDINAAARAIEKVTEVSAKSQLRGALVPYRLDVRTKFSKELPAVLATYGLPVLPGIRNLTLINECDMAGLTMGEYAPTSAARLEFSELAAACNRMLRQNRTKRKSA